MYPASQCGRNPSGIDVDVDVDVDDVTRSFGSLRFSTDLTFRQSATASQSNDASSSGNSVADYDRILGFRNFVTSGENYSSDVHNLRQENVSGSMHHRNWYSNPQDFGAGNSTPNSFCDCPMPSFVDNSPFLPHELRFRPIGRPIELHSDNSPGNQEVSGPRDGLMRIQYILQWGNYEQKQTAISVLKDNVFWLINDREINFLFPCLLDACEDEQLNSIVEDVLSQSDFCINAAFCIWGANSISILIRKVRRSRNHASTMTNILSTRFLDIMTHRIARKVIKQCLDFFGTQPNKILYENTIHHFKYLAIHEVGCLSLNDCINTISGEHKDILLDKIAEVSDYLSNDPFGNFVVQNVLSLRDMRVAAKILNCLKGQFVYLSQKKGGSHVVERCMESSSLGLKYAVDEIVGAPKAALLLALDQFGNYIIQKALKRTKKSREFGNLHHSLVKCLEPHCRELNRTKGGRNIIHLLQSSVAKPLL